MKVSYTEKFEIPGIPFLGIEDYKDGRPLQEHFFGERWKENKEPRYKCWCGGGGLGSATTLEEARRKLWHYAVQRLNEKKQELEKNLAEASKSLEGLESDAFSMASFKVKLWNHERDSK